jgi:hypothetical protein
MKKMSFVTFSSDRKRKEGDSAKQKQRAGEFHLCWGDRIDKIIEHQDPYNLKKDLGQM